MTTATATLLLARAHARMVRQRAREALQDNRLLVATIGVFLAVYCAATYVLVSQGLQFVAAMPLFGELLVERLVHLLFFFFFVMLVVSNAAITGMGLFRRVGMDWQVALPLPWSSLVLWKTLEGMLLASWGLLVLSAPVLAALGRVFKAGPVFYLAGLPALLCLVGLAACLSTWLLLLLVSHVRRSWWKAAAVLGLVPAFLVLRPWLTAGEDPAKRDLLESLQGVMRHSEIFIHPLLPSSWVAEVLFAAAGRGTPGSALFHLLLLLAHALLALHLTARFGTHHFYTAWHRVMTAGPWFRGNAAAKPWFRRPVPEQPTRAGRSERALLAKDVRTFLREPAQWGQCLVIFSLLFIYTLNLQRLGHNLQSTFWVTVISHLNLLVCCLALSTLTTRFVFPQISLEGQRLWILGLSPLSLGRIMDLKLCLASGAMSLLTLFLVLLSCATLALPWDRSLVFGSAVILISYGLNALALALGAWLPNFREPNPARIISGFGGTLCLVSSFLYILLSAGVLAAPEIYRWKHQGAAPSVATPLLQDGMALLLVFFLTLLFGTLPYRVAKNRTKHLDYLGKL
jgi:ABC-2 type transport system permease protein